MRAIDKSRRKKQRGSVLVEALIVIPTLISIILASRYVYSSGASALDTLYAARQEAWTHTIDGCGPLWDVDAILSNRVVSVLRMAFAPASIPILAEPTGNESWWDSAMQLVVELLQGEDVYIAHGVRPNSPPPVESSNPLNGAPPDPGSSLDVLMGCNVRPHDLGTRRSLIQWARELVFN